MIFLMSLSIFKIYSLTFKNQINLEKKKKKRFSDFFLIFSTLKPLIQTTKHYEPVPSIKPRMLNLVESLIKKAKSLRKPSTSTIYQSSQSGLNGFKKPLDEMSFQDSRFLLSPFSEKPHRRKMKLRPTHREIVEWI